MYNPLSVNDVIESFRAAMLEKDIEFQGEIIPDGKLHRFHVEGDSHGSKNGFYILHFDEKPAGQYGCNKRYGSETKFPWQYKSAIKMSATELAEYRARNEKAKQEREAKEQARFAEIAEIATAQWEAATPAPADHPYLVRKGINPHDARVGTWTRINEQTGEVWFEQENTLLVTICDRTGKIHSLQGIFPEKNQKLGRDKDYLLGGKKRELFHPFGRPQLHHGVPVFILCEGFATGASINEATGHVAMACLDAGNLPVVAKQIHDRLAAAKKQAIIIIAADNDRWTHQPMENPGVHHARVALKACGNMGRIVIPEFTDLSGEPTDFNDLHQREGLQAVADMILAALPNPEDPAAEPEPEPAPEPEQDPVDPENTPTDTNGDGCMADAADDELERDGHFTVLGYDGPTYYIFHHDKGQVMELTKSDLTDNGMIELAPLFWWEEHFPGEKGMNKKMAANWFFRLANSRGIYDPSRIRGRGAWRDKGRHVFHLGDQVVVDGEVMGVTHIQSRYVYQMARRMPEPEAQMLTSAEGAHLLQVASMVRWSKAASAPLLAGWTFLAPICGALRWRPHVWITGGAGSGKAQPHSAKVLTPSGWRDMGDLMVGDLVSTPDDGFARILGVYPQGKQKTYCITFADGRTTRATGDHLWKVRVENSWRIRTTEQMIEMLSRGTRASKSLAIPLPDPMTIAGNNKIQLPLHPYVLGLMISDGSFANEDYQPARAMCLTCFDPEIVERARAVLNGSHSWLFDTNTKGRYNFGDLSRYGKVTRNVIKELRLLGTLSHSKFIPESYLNASIQDRIELLKGLMDTDGHAGEGGSISYCTVSERLARDFTKLVRSLGGIAAISEKQTSHTYKGEKKLGLPAFNINVRFKDPTIAFSLQRKLDRVSADHQYSNCLYLNVKSIEQDSEENCSCIMIDHPDRLYVTDNFVVTHNTTVQRDFASALLSGIGVFAQGNSTEAGIRQELRADALPVLIDEAESSDDKERTRMEAILSMIRQSSSESQAKTLKGTIGGSSSRYNIRSMFCLASINTNIDKKADIDRLTKLVILPPKDAEATEAHWAKLSDELHKISTDETIAGRMLARALYLMPIITQSVDVFCKVAARHFGSQREGDQFGTLMAGAWSLTRDTVPTEAEAQGMINAFNWEEHTEDNDVDDADKALEAILSAKIKVGHQVGDMSVYELIRETSPLHNRNLLEKNEALRLLIQNGIKVDKSEVVFGTSVTNLRALVSKTAYVTDLRGQLLRLPGATRLEGRTVRFNGFSSKCVSLPLNNILAGDVSDLPPI